MKKDITDLINAFNREVKKKLVDSIDYQFEHGADDWDELTEKIFDEIVAARINEITQKKCSIKYGTWGGKYQNSILAKVSKHTRVLIGKVRNSEIEWSPVDYEEIEILKDLTFAFREFYYPLTEPANINCHLKYAHGESKDGNTIFSLLIENCSFFIK